MKLFAILSWYDESPTWLAATVASLSKIGVDHLVAVDGAYKHFDGDARSGLEQSEAILMASEAAHLGVTLVRPIEKLWTEQQKRDYCFKVVQTLAEPLHDWVTIIDGDELFIEGTHDFKHKLFAAEEHVAACVLRQSIDPQATNGLHNTDRTPAIYRGIETDPTIRHLQSRFWRVLHNMRVTQNHYSFYGEDDSGVTWNLRPDVDKPVEDSTRSGVLIVDDAIPVIEHRDPWRTAWRRNQKSAYYALRDELGLERA